MGSYHGLLKINQVFHKKFKFDPRGNGRDLGSPHNF